MTSNVHKLLECIEGMVKVLDVVAASGLALVFSVNNMCRRRLGRGRVYSVR